MADEAPPRLSDISTSWTVVCRAHAGTEAQMEAARRELLDRYGGAVSRYLHGAAREPEAAAELYQEFALRFLRGDFRRAAPEAGRFRAYVKTALLNLVARHHARRQGGPRPLDGEVADPTPTADDRADAEFVRCWRADLLARAWRALEGHERESGRPFYRALRLRVDEPEQSSEELASRLGAALDRPVTAAGFRQTLHRAREAFADLLLREVAASLADPTAEEVERELADLRLLEYCRPALTRFGDGR